MLQFITDEGITIHTSIFTPEERQMSAGQHIVDLNKGWFSLNDLSCTMIPVFLKIVRKVSQ